jgi:hypothetical protein
VSKQAIFSFRSGRLAYSRSIDTEVMWLLSDFVRKMEKVAAETNFVRTQPLLSGIKCTADVRQIQATFLEQTQKESFPHMESKRSTWDCNVTIVPDSVTECNYQFISPINTFSNWVARAGCVSKLSYLVRSCRLRTRGAWPMRPGPPGQLEVSHHYHEHAINRYLVKLSSLFVRCSVS